MHDAEFTCALFRFIQLTCEGHNLGKTKYILIFNCVINLSYFRMAELFADAGREHHHRQCCNLHGRLPATTPRIYNGLLLALF